MVDDDSLYYRTIIDNRNSINGIYNKYKSKLTPPKGKEISNCIKGTLQKIKYFKIFSYKSSNKTIYSLDAYENTFIKSYARMTNSNIKFYPYYDFSSFFRKSKQTSIELNAVIQELTKILMKFGEYHNTMIPNNVKNYLNELIKQTLNQTNYLIQSYYTDLKRLKKRTFYLPSLGYIHSRAFGIAGKQAGHTIIGSTHGNSIGLHDSLNHALIDLPIVDKYLVATESVAKNYSNLARKYIEGINYPEIIPIKSDYYKRLLKKHKLLSPVTEIKTIMVLEYPLTEQRHNIYSFWPYQAELMIRLGKFFKSIGIEPIMKRHPDRLYESDGLYDNSYNRQLKDPFESVFEQADAYFFMNISSTTFGFALTTNRPIFIFSTWLDDVWGDMIPMLKTRCNIIPSRIDSDGMLQFDKEKLIAKTNSINKWEIDYSIVNKFMIS